MRTTDTEQANVKFQRTLGLLREADTPFTAEAIYSLSDLYGDQLGDFRALWPVLSADRRRTLIQRLVETAETNFELDFSAIIALGLDDPNRDVRVAAIEGVLEESPRRVVERLLQLAQDDPHSDVRAVATQTLGQFVLMGELGKLPQTLNARLQDTILALHRNLNEDLDVRRRALEALSNCGHESVPDMIRQAYYHDDERMRVSALFAMGRSCDEAWIPQIMEELSSDSPEMRYEAARAAGELELRPAVARLVELAYDDDREIQEIAIWSLGEIGGQAASRALTELAALATSSEDDDLAEAVAEAQSAASLAGDDLLPLFDFSDYDDELVDDLDGNPYGDDDDYDEYDDEDDVIDGDYDELDEIDEIDGFDPNDLL